MKPIHSRYLHIVVYLTILVLWILLGNFEAIEAPYVNF